MFPSNIILYIFCDHCQPIDSGQVSMGKTLAVVWCYNLYAYGGLIPFKPKNKLFGTKVFYIVTKTMFGGKVFVCSEFLCQ